MPSHIGVRRAQRHRPSCRVRSTRQRRSGRRYARGVTTAIQRFVTYYTNLLRWNNCEAEMCSHTWPPNQTKPPILAFVGEVGFFGSSRLADILDQRKVRPIC